MFPQESEVTFGYEHMIEQVPTAVKDARAVCVDTIGIHDQGEEDDIAGYET